MRTCTTHGSALPCVECRDEADREQTCIECAGLRAQIGAQAQIIADLRDTVSQLGRLMDMQAAAYTRLSSEPDYRPQLAESIRRATYLTERSKKQWERGDE